VNNLNDLNYCELNRFFENFPQGLSFNKTDKIGARIRSAEGGGEEICFFLSGYCSN
jgi:hypothetical protein